MREKIIELLKQYGPLSYDALCHFLNPDKVVFDQTISAMEDNEIIKFGKKYFLIDGKEIARGIITIKAGHGYFKVDKESYFIDDNNLGRAFDKDIAIAKINKNDRGIMEAIPVKICGHSNLTLVCRATKKSVRNYRVFEVLDINSTYEEIFVPIEKLNGAKLNDMCILKVIYQKDKMLGEVIEIVGKTTAIGADILALVLSSHVPYFFDKKVTDSLANIPNHVLAGELANRKDFTTKKIFTIDGDDSKDFDDAVSLEILSNGHYELGVHIADVSHYVKEGSPLDDEAFKRGNSIYLVDRVIPMLPFELSNGICSLNEGVIRLTLSCIMEIDQKGEVIFSHLERSYIKSVHRMTYKKVNQMLIEHDEALINEYSDIYDILVKMNELAQKVRQKRQKRGGLDFDIPEMKIMVDEKGKPTNITRRERDKAEMLIEDFMLLANEEVAKTLSNLDYPCVYRVHEEPNKDKLMALNPLLTKFNAKFSHLDKKITPLMVSKVMAEIKDSTSYEVINSLLLRAMAKARYDGRSLGHFGLALKYYCHFTSPIRRYADLMVHRIINELLFEPQDFNHKIEHFNTLVHKVALVTSECEKKAVELERNVDDMKAAEYMMERIGNIYVGKISGVTSFGLFVSLDNGVEGLVHIKNMPELYDFNEETMTLRGLFSNKIYSFGDKIKIKVIGASKEKRQIDFALAS